MNLRQKKLLIIIISLTFVLGLVGFILYSIFKKDGIESPKDKREQCKVTDFKNLPEIFVRETHMKNVKVKQDKTQHSK
jgi:hypothetical protein